MTTSRAPRRPVTSIEETVEPKAGCGPAALPTLLKPHLSVASQAFTHIDTRPIWEIASGRYGMDRTRPPGERWHWQSFPPCRKILDAWKKPSHQCKQICIQAGSQTWKTAMMLICAAWSVKHRPVPKLWLTAKDDLAKDISMERLIPTLERSPDLRDLLLDGRLAHVERAQ